MVSWPDDGAKSNFSDKTVARSKLDTREMEGDSKEIKSLEHLRHHREAATFEEADRGSYIIMSQFIRGGSCRILPSIGMPQRFSRLVRSID